MSIHRYIDIYICIGGNDSMYILYLSDTNLKDSIMENWDLLQATYKVFDGVTPLSVQPSLDSLMVVKLVEE